MEGKNLKRSTAYKTDNKNRKNKQKIFAKEARLKRYRDRVKQYKIKTRHS